MRRISLWLLLAVCLATTAPPPNRAETADSHVQQALTGKTDSRAKAVAELRELGPEGLARLVRERAQRQEASAANADPTRGDTLLKELEDLNALIDEVGGAKYCSVSKLYWYTDLERAKAAAAREHKPLLCLRMMGKLNEEFSCANSRFFRTTLYANAEISQTLRDKFILHWGSVRPVPKVTIDFGDGRKLERTLTGNSIHYVLDSSGRVLDGLPGLYGPRAFQQWLGRAGVLAKQYAAAKTEDRDALLTQYHAARLVAIASAWSADIAKLNAPAPQAAILGRAARDAAAAAMLARPKADVELPIIRQIASFREIPPSIDALDDTQWGRLAALHADDAELDNASIALIRAQNPAADRAGRLAVTKMRVEDPLVRLVRGFQTSIALDTVRNEYVLHRQLHEWFASGAAAQDIDSLNERVYAELFLTPSSDPWLGLMPADAYTALPNGGVTSSK
jgi:hypothetical protein